MPWELEVCLFVENQDLGPRAVVAPSAGSAYVLSFLHPFLESKKMRDQRKTRAPACFKVPRELSGLRSWP